MDNLCRVCLKSLDGVEFINISYEVEENWTILETLIDFANIEVENEDRLPKYICKNCKDKVIDFIDFRKTIVTSDEYLKGLDLSHTEEPDNKLDLIKSEELCFNEQSVNVNNVNVKIEPEYIDVDEPYLETESVDIKEESEVETEALFNNEEASCAVIMNSKKRKNYSQENLEIAINQIKEKQISIRQASIRYQVPKSTLIDTLKGRYRNPGILGGPTMLTNAEEEILVQWVLEMDSLGFPVTKPQLIESVTKLIKNLKRPNSFKNGQPGHKWFTGFLSRHPKISKRIPQSLKPCRAAVTETNIRNWFGRVITYMEENNLLHILKDPKRIFNCGESGFFLSPQEKQVLVKKGSKAAYNRIANDKKECLRVLLNIGADGAVPPPLVIFPYKRHIPASIIVNMPRHWGVGHSESGWMTSELFYEYISNVFYPWIKEFEIPLPVILFLDGHSSHINITLTEFCKKNGIILMAFYPNATHLLQPLDVGVFLPLKNSWRSSVCSWRTNNTGKKMERSDFSKVLKETMDSSLTTAIVQKAFQACGLFPFNENSIDYSKLIKLTSNENTTTVNNYLINKSTELNSETLRSAVEACLDSEILEKFKRYDAEPDMIIEERFLELFNFWKNYSQ